MPTFYVSIACGTTCDSFARMHSGTCLAGRGAIDFKNSLKILTYLDSKL
jgi:hypothetical protein